MRVNIADALFAREKFVLSAETLQSAFGFVKVSVIFSFAEQSLEFLFVTLPLNVTAVPWDEFEMESKVISGAFLTHGIGAVPTSEQPLGRGILVHEKFASNVPQAVGIVSGGHVESTHMLNDFTSSQVAFDNTAEHSMSVGVLAQGLGHVAVPL